jgi:FAD/FMN-containing dehydrogenase
LSHLRLNRMLAFDEAQATLECEAGTSLGDILDVFLPRGFFLPVAPGTRHVTVGGAIASDIHGKNHHRDGTFARFVDSLCLLTPAWGAVECSPKTNSRLFWATVGGMGLTGAILSARIRLPRVESAFVEVRRRRGTNLEEVLAGLTEGDGTSRYSVAWIDTLGRRRALGRGVLVHGNHAPASTVRATRREPLVPPRRRNWRLPVDLPAFAVNRWSAAAFNRLYWATHRDAAEHLVPMDSFFFPLDGVAEWNRAYGTRGFVQYQVALPLAGGEAGMVRLLEQIAESPRPSILAVLKRFGDADPGILSFPQPGWTLALDIPAAPGIRDFLARLDVTVLEHGGRVYLAKDAALSPASFRAMYPRWEELLEMKAQADPGGVLRSSLAERVGLV